MKHKEHKVYSAKACIKPFNGKWLKIKALQTSGLLEAAGVGCYQYSYPRTARRPGWPPHGPVGSVLMTGLHFPEPTPALLSAQQPTLSDSHTVTTAPTPSSLKSIVTKFLL